MKLFNCIKVIMVTSFCILMACQSVPKRKFESESLIIQKNASLTPPVTLTEAMVEDDINYLIYALENGYGGRKYVSQVAFEKALKELSKVAGAMSSENLKDRIDTILLGIPDNHLKARLDGNPSPARAKDTPKQDVGLNAISDKDKVWEVRLDKKNGKRVLFVSIMRFPSHKDSIWKNFIKEAKKHLKISEILVLDLRGNGGGDDTMGFELAQLLFGNAVNSPIGKQYVSQTPETLVIFANGIRLSEIQLKNKGQAVPPYFEESYNEVMDKYQKAKQGVLPPERIELSENKQNSFNSEKGYNKPIYILMDGACGSSCESTIDVFEEHPKVKRVGQNTRGTLQFGNVGKILLPHSRINVQIPTHYNEYRDKRIIEKIGIKPDIEVPKGVDAYNFIFMAATY